MKKVLFVATVVKKHIMVFHLPYLEWFHQNGFEVHVCARNDYDNKVDCKIPFCDKYYDLPFERSPANINNVKVYKQLSHIINTYQYDIIHCHTPMGGALTRLASRDARRNGSKVIYTAHGFHFYQGASLLNWLFYYNAEKWLSRFTDILITINQEDFQRAKNFRMNRLEYVPGVGVDTSKFSINSINKFEKRKNLGLPEDAIVILSVGEINKNKNHELVLNSIKKIEHEKVFYVICGQGPNDEHLLKMSEKYGIGNNLKLLGFRNDINEIYKIADIFAFPSLREGLSIALMESMTSSLPVVCTNIRGNRDLIDHNKGGFVVNPESVDDFAEALQKLVSNEDLRMQMGRYNNQRIITYDIHSVMKQMSEIYNTVERFE